MWVQSADGDGQVGARGGLARGEALERATFYETVADWLPYGCRFCMPERKEPVGWRRARAHRLLLLLLLPACCLLRGAAGAWLVLCGLLGPAAATCFCCCCFCCLLLLLASACLLRRLLRRLLPAPAAASYRCPLPAASCQSATGRSPSARGACVRGLCVAMRLDALVRAPAARVPCLLALVESCGLTRPLSPPRAARQSISQSVSFQPSGTPLRLASLRAARWAGRRHGAGLAALASPFSRRRPSDALAS